MTKGEDGKLTCTIKDNDGKLTEITGCDQVMMATGRAPKTHGLGLEEVGVKIGRSCASSGLKIRSNCSTALRPYSTLVGRWWEVAMCSVCYVILVTALLINLDAATALIINLGGTCGRKAHHIYYPQYGVMTPGYLALKAANKPHP